MSDEFNQKNPPIDDWSLPPSNISVPPADNNEDWVMTNPLDSQIKETPKDGWTMPEPTFRISDGYCPVKLDKNAADYVKSKKNQAPVDETLANLYAPPTPTENLPDMTMHNISLSDLKAELAAEKPPSPSSAKPPIEPQPDISDQFNIQAVAPEIIAEKKERSKTTRTILAVLGISAMVLFAVAFLIVVLYFFFPERFIR